MNIFKKIFQEIDKRKPSKVYNKEIFDKTLNYQKKYGFEIDLDLDSKNPMWNNEADAFKHAFFSADLAYRYNSPFGKALGDKHERDGDKFNEQPFGEKNMDLWNNSVGRRTGVELENQIKASKKTYSREEIDDMLAEKIIQKMQNGELITSPDDPRKYAEPSPKDRLKNIFNFKSENLSSQSSSLSNSPSVANRLIQQPQVNTGRINLQHLAGLPTPSAAGFLNAALMGATGIFRGLGAVSAIPGIGDFFNGIFQKTVETSVHGQILNLPSYHSGGQVPGQGEMLAVLKGGETVRTKAQEDELQQSLYEKYAESYAPLVCGGRDDSNKESGQNTSQNKPIHQQITKDDEVFILSLISDALERNRMGLRNQVKAI